jgi:C-terminal processing protease CtpA/Prc
MSVRTLAAGRAVYFQFNTVRRPLQTFVRKLQRLAFATSTRRVIVDLRLNGGGDNTTYGPLLDLLRSKKVNRPGKLYLLTGRATFSAAANFAADVDRYTRAIFVGEPSGGGVETYGDTSAVSLPTAGLTAHIATRYHERKKGPRDHRLAVEPDIGIDLTSAQYFAGRDPVLERALRAL